MSRDSDEPVYLYDVTLFLVTDRAIQIGEEDAPESERVWIPVSQIFDTDLDYHADDCLYTEGYVAIPRWLYKKKIEEGKDWLEGYD